jgi:ribosome-associated protein
MRSFLYSVKGCFQSSLYPLHEGFASGPIVHYPVQASLYQPEENFDVPTKPKTVKPARKTKPAAKPSVKKSSAKTLAAKKSTAKPAVVKKAPILRKVVKAKAKPKQTKLNEMPEQIRDVMLRVLEDRQAEEITTLNLRGKSSVADYLIIASGRAARQLTAIAELIRAELSKLGIKQIRTEGAGEANWVLLDAGDVILHLFRPEVRLFYNIEQIYTEKPMK